MVYPHTYRTEHSETRTTNANYGDYYAVMSSKKIKIQPPLLKLLQYVDSNQNEFVEDLRDAVKIKSVSGDPKYSGEMIRMVRFIENWMVKMGAKYECFNIGHITVDGKQMRMPQVVLGTVKGQSHKTVLVYGNVDVKKPTKKCWSTDPWDVVELDKALYGNGVAQSKGPLMCWFHTIMAFKNQGIPLPVNVKFCIEGMYYHKSAGLRSFLMTQKQQFLAGIDFVVVCDSEWLGEKYPCVSYGVVGFLHFDLTVTQSGESDVRADCDKIVNEIADGYHVRVPHFDKFVLQITPDEEQMYEAITYNMDEVRKKLPPEMKKWNKTRLLMYYWRKPTIHVSDMEECTCEKKDASSVVKRHFIVKIVPKQVADVCVEQVIRHARHVAKELGVESQTEVTLQSESRPWLENCASVNYEAARRATIQVYKEDPSMIREDHDSACINVLQMIEKNILLLPICANGGNGGGHNERMFLRNYYEGTKLIGAYLFQLGMLAR